MFQAAAWLISQFYELTSNYVASIALVALVIMLLIFPLTLKSTKSMLEMQRVQPEMRRLQQQYRNDRQKLNEEMMKLYQEHKVNEGVSNLQRRPIQPCRRILIDLILSTSKRNGWCWRLLLRRATPVQISNEKLWSYVHKMLQSIFVNTPRISRSIKSMQLKRYPHCYL